MKNRQKTTILLVPGDSITDNVIEYRVCNEDFMLRFDATNISNTTLDACKKCLPESAVLEMRLHSEEENRIGCIAVFSVPGNDVGSIKLIEVAILEEPDISL